MGHGWTLGSVRVVLPCAAFNSSLCLLPQKLEYTMGDSSDVPSRKELTSEELCKQMDKLLKENPNNQRIYDWIEVRVGAQHPSVWRLPPGFLSTSQSFTLPPPGQPERAAGLVQHVYQGPDDVCVPLGHCL